VVLPITDETVYPTLTGSQSDGYDVRLFPAIDGFFTGQLTRDEVEEVTATTTEVAFEWIEIACPLLVLNATGVEDVGSTVVLPSPFLPFTPGDTVLFPITENAIYPTISGSFPNGYPITVQPASVSPASGIFDFEVLASGALVPASFEISGITFSLSCQTNRPPVADAGDNLAIFSSEQATTTVLGQASDPDGDPLSYRWFEGGDELLGSTGVGALGEAPLDLGSLAPLALGDHVLTLEVSDDQATAVSQMTLTIANSPPTVACSGSGTFQLGLDTVFLEAVVADVDGDTLLFQWVADSLAVASGSQLTVEGGAPSDLPVTGLTTGTDPSADLNLGTHIITLTIDDGANDPVQCDVVADVVDTEAPTLAPVADPAILWPPNHKLVDVVIEANAFDSSGGPVVLEASVVSSEDPLKDGSGNTIPDFTEPVIDQSTGTISVQLRAERAGNGPGRVYTITVMATDTAGNQSTAAVSVAAPRDQRRK
jgi:hypothetical protein